MYKRLLPFLLVTVICGCRDQIVHNVSEIDANRIITSLNERQIEARKERQPDGKWQITVNSNKVLPAIELLTANRLLRPEPVVATARSGIMLSRDEQRFHHERELSREIENTLRGMRGILEARVHLNLPVVDPLFGQTLDATRASASVLLLTDEEPVDREEVSKLVGGASGIPAASISVVLTGAKLPSSFASKLAVDGMNAQGDSMLQMLSMNGMGIKTGWVLVGAAFILVMFTALANSIRSRGHQ